MKRWALVSYDTETEQLDIWQCNKKGEALAEKMTDAYEICTNAISSKCSDLENCGDGSNLGYFILDSIRLNNKLELMKEQE